MKCCLEELWRLEGISAVAPGETAIAIAEITGLDRAAGACPNEDRIGMAAMHVPEAAESGFH